MKESIFTSSIRSLLVAFFSVVGILLAIFLMALLYSTIDSTEDPLSSSYSVKIVPNAKGIRKKQSSSAPVVLQVNINGVIGMNDLTQSKISEMLVESREDTLKKDRVKAILLCCNTPGGGMTDADGIFRAVKEYKERYKVPVFAYVDGLLASGGMYIGAAADEIHASDVSLIGSVGVITSAYLNLSHLLEKIGVNSLTLFAGKGKDDLNPLRPWKPGEEDNLKEIIQYYYNSFVDLVVANRPIDRTVLVDKIGANILPAEQALKYGFIDVAGASRQTTLERLLKRIGIEDDFYQVIELENNSWLSQLLRSESPAKSGTFKHQLVTGLEVPPELNNQLLLLYRP